MSDNKKPRIVVIGSLNMDVVVEAERAPKMGETVLGQKVHFLPGGKGANQAVALARLGADVTMIGAIGQDAFGKQIMQSLEQENIRTDAIKRKNYATTGMAQIVIAEGDNSIIVVPGANDDCRPEDIDRHVSRIAEADAVLLQLEIPQQTVEYAAKTAKKYGKKVILNPAPVRQLSNELLRHVDVITPNETELTALTGQSIDKDQALAAAMKQLMAAGPSHVITTLGKAGSAWIDEEGRLCQESAHAMQVVDTTGAGDCFNAGLTWALSCGKTLAVSVTFANQSAALSITRLGAQSGMPTMEEVHSYFNSIQKQSAQEG